MSETQLFTYVITSLGLVYFAGYQWGKYARIVKDLGTAA